MTEEEINIKIQNLNQVFTPAAPILTKELFFGRIDQLKKVLDTIREPGQHAILYGDRGVGKTSLANILHERLQGIIVTKVICNRTEKFKDLWNKTLKRISIVSKAQGFGFTATEVDQIKQLNLFLPEQEVDSTDILSTLEFLTTRVLFIFDEFDSVVDTDTRVRFTDTIKALSDSSHNITIVLVGVAKSVNDIISIHPSIERCMKQIQIPRMSPDELLQIIDNGLKTLEMSIDPFVRLDIVDFSHGFPHFTHLLSKYAAKTALASDTLHISRHDFDISIDEALSNVSESIRDLYQRATSSSHTGALYPLVLNACALAKEDEHHAFRAADLIQPMKDISGKSYRVSAYGFHLSQLCSEFKGPVLEKVGKGKMNKYKFRHPLLRAYVRLRMYQTGAIKTNSSIGTDNESQE